MIVFKILFKNILRHKLRSFLTILGIAIAVLSFGLLRVILSAWYYGVESSLTNRLIVRHAVSFIFPLPIAYQMKIAQIPGVKLVSHATWFQGIYIDMKHFFPRMAIDTKTYLTVYPEFLISEVEYNNFLRERNACIIGAKIARQYNLKIGDLMNIEGDIYPGNWQFVIKGIYHGKYENTDETQMFFHWDYLEQRLRKEAPGRAGYVGWFVVWIDNPDNAAAISYSIDKLFKNSNAETKTETEKAFQQSFVSMSGAIITAIKVISYLIIGIIMLVLANTMIMNARERMTEFTVLRVLGFSTFKVSGLIFGESIIISLLGSTIGIIFIYPIVKHISLLLANFFPVFKIDFLTLMMVYGLGFLIGIFASIIPLKQILTIKVVDGLRKIE